MDAVSGGNLTFMSLRPKCRSLSGPHINCAIDAGLPTPPVSHWEISVPIKKSDQKVKKSDFLSDQFIIKNQTKIRPVLAIFNKKSDCIMTLNVILVSVRIGQFS